MEDKKSEDNKGKQPINDAKSSAESKITETEVIKSMEEIQKSREECKEGIKKLVTNYATTNNATFQDVRELYAELGREVEDVFFDHRVQMIVNELDKRYKLKNE